MHTAKLVWVTPDAERLIGKLARVSNPANEDNPNVERLIKYLIKHKHWSPFEMASMCVEIQTTRAIGAQILRHRSFSFQEFSQRYAEVTEIEVPQLRRQDLNNRQNSIDDFPEELSEELQDMITLHNDKSNSLYKKLLAYGVAKECARNVLPLSTKTRMYMSGTIRSWLHYIDLRASHGTQVEHSQIAKQIGEILDTELPTISRAMWS
jgi:thymidylate synthase (FAD)